MNEALSLPVGSALSESDGCEFEISTGSILLPSSPIIDQMYDRWNPEHYNVSREPLHVGSVVCRREFSQQNNLTVLDMPIKFPHSRRVRLPQDLVQFEETVSKICDFESSINFQLDDYYAYLTVDQRTVNPGTTQRVPGKHVDGIQGRNVKDKVAVEQTYIVSDTLTTTAYVQPFDFSGKSVNTYNWFELMEEQAKPASAAQGQPYEIYLIDPYTVHAGTPATEVTDRTFVRLEFSLREYDRIQNTRNPLFDYHWNMVERPLPTDLL
jgi:effector-binding domain-containing protein